MHTSKKSYSSQSKRSSSRSLSRWLNIWRGTKWSSLASTFSACFARKPSTTVAFQLCTWVRPPRTTCFASSKLSHSSSNHQVFLPLIAPKMQMKAPQVQNKVEVKLYRTTHRVVQWDSRLENRAPKMVKNLNNLSKMEQLTRKKMIKILSKLKKRHCVMRKKITKLPKRVLRMNRTQMVRKKIKTK